MKEMSSTPYLRSLFVDRKERSARIVYQGFIGVAFCYIELESRSKNHHTLRLKNDDKQVAQVTFKIEENLAVIEKMAAHPKLDDIAFLYPLMLQLLIKAINSDYEAILMPGMNGTRPNFLHAFDRCGTVFKLEDGWLKLGLHSLPSSSLQQQYQAISARYRQAAPILAAVREKIKKASNRAVTEFQVVDFGRPAGGASYWIEKSVDPEPTFMLLNHSENIIFMQLTLSPDGQGIVRWNGYRAIQLDRAELFIRLLGHLLLHCFVHRLKVIEIQMRPGVEALYPRLLKGQDFTIKRDTKLISAKLLIS